MAIRINPITGQLEEDNTLDSLAAPALPTPTPMGVATPSTVDATLDIANKQPFYPTPSGAPVAPTTPMPTPEPATTPPPGGVITRSIETGRNEETSVTKSQQTAKEGQIEKDQLKLDQANLETQQKQNEINKEKAKIEALQSADEATRKAAFEEQKNAIIDAGNEEIKNRTAEYDSQYEKYKSMDIKDYWADKSTGLKIVAAIAMGVGAFGAALQGKTTNDAAGIITSAIDRDFQRQKENILKQRDVVGAAKEGIGVARSAKVDQLADLNLKQAAALDTIAAKYEAALKQKGVSEAEIQGDATLNKIKQEALSRKQAVEQGLRASVTTKVEKSIAQAQYDATTGEPIAGPRGKVTEDQAKAETYLNDMKSAAGEMNKSGVPSKKAYEQVRAYEAQNKLGFGGANVGALRDALGLRGGREEGLSAKDQQAMAAQNAWISAYIKSRTGAGENVQEAENYARSMMPREGDSKEVLATKAKLREDAMKSTATRAGLPSSSSKPKEAAKEAAPKPRPKVGEVRNGYKYKGGDPNKQDSWEKQ